MYQGAAAGAPGYFASLGYPCPKHENPADHILDTISEGVGLDKVLKNSAAINFARLVVQRSGFLLLSQMMILNLELSAQKLKYVLKVYIRFVNTDQY